jgi:hypothetical protein
MKVTNCFKTNVASDLGGSTERVASRKIFARMCDFLRKLTFSGLTVDRDADISPGRLGPVTKKSFQLEKIISNKTATLP